MCQHSPNRAPSNQCVTFVTALAPDGIRTNRCIRSRADSFPRIRQLRPQSEGALGRRTSARQKRAGTSGVALRSASGASSGFRRNVTFFVTPCTHGTPTRSRSHACRFRRHAGASESNAATHHPIRQSTGEAVAKSEAAYCSERRWTILRTVAVGYANGDGRARTERRREIIVRTSPPPPNSHGPFVTAVVPARTSD